MKGVVKDSRRGLAFRTADKSFIENDAGGPNVYDGLEGHRKRNMGAGIADFAALGGMKGEETIVGVPEGAILAFQSLLKRCRVKGCTRSFAHTCLWDRTTYADVW